MPQVDSRPDDERRPQHRDNASAGRKRRGDNSPFLVGTAASESHPGRPSLFAYFCMIFFWFPKISR